MFYKLMNGNMVTDLLREVRYVRYLPHSKRWVNTDKMVANGVMGANGNVIYHISGRGITYPEDIVTVEMVEIGEDEYNYLAANASIQQEENKILRQEIDGLKEQLNEQSLLLQQILAKL